MDRDKVIQELSKLLGDEYFLRWVDHKTTMGDFSGRDTAIDVFNVPTGKAREIYSLTSDFRHLLYKETGESITLITHTPEATKEFYSHIVPDSCSE